MPDPRARAGRKGLDRLLSHLALSAHGALTALSAAVAPTPTPTPTREFDETVITPGPLGFLAMALVTIAVVLLIVDMVRRIRRVRYRAEVREEIEREQAAARDGAGEAGPSGADAAPGTEQDGPTDAPPRA